MLILLMVAFVVTIGWQIGGVWDQLGQLGLSLFLSSCSLRASASPWGFSMCSVQEGAPGVRKHKSGSCRDFLRLSVASATFCG